MTPIVLLCPLGTKHKEVFSQCAQNRVRNESFTAGVEHLLEQSVLGSFKCLHFLNSFAAVVVTELPVGSQLHKFNIL
jgi:hypothetical protein